MEPLEVWTCQRAENLTKKTHTREVNVREDSDSFCNYEKASIKGKKGEDMNREVIVCNVENVEVLNTSDECLLSEAIQVGAIQVHASAISRIIAIAAPLLLVSHQLDSASFVRLPGSLAVFQTTPQSLFTSPMFCAGFPTHSATVTGLLYETSIVICRKLNGGMWPRAEEIISLGNCWNQTLQ